MKKNRLVAAVATFFVLTTASGSNAKGPEIGQTAPQFVLVDTQGQKRALSDFKGKYVVLEWINHGCPFVKKHYGSGNMQALQKEYADKGVVWLSICSSAKGKEGYMTNETWNKAVLEKKAFPSAILPDIDGTVGKLYGAKTTPHMFVVDPEGILIYRGAIDDTPGTDPSEIKGAKNYIRAALDEAMNGKPVTSPSTTSYGCSVKYK